MTPQVGCSWVSFETNAELDAALSLIEGVLTIFSPGKAAISIMANKVSMSGFLHIYEHKHIYFYFF